MKWLGPGEGMLSNGQPTEMSSINLRQGAPRSQDDATVAYFFQRPQTDPDFQSYAKHARWTGGDDTVLEVSAF